MRSPIHIFSVAEYLDAECKSELRHEYLGGQVFAMAGGSNLHSAGLLGKKIFTTKE